MPETAKAGTKLGATKIAGRIEVVQETRLEELENEKPIKQKEPRGQHSEVTSCMEHSGQLEYISQGKT